MKIYLVGGAVRDKLLGIPIKEKDWVVVGATPQEMLTAGFKQVGKDFPVFLHPKTNEEYALARMERKIEPGYKGFSFDVSPHVSLEEDLKRRDLTINAMAQTQSGELIDPFDGKEDLDNKILRHVSSAFTEDPVRILRVGRFLARFANMGFKIAPETLRLMHEMVLSGEVNALVPERVWKELERALGEECPEKFFAALNACGAMSILFPYLTADGFGINALKSAVKLSKDTTIRFAALTYAMPEQGSNETPKKIINELCDRYRIPNAYRELALLSATYYPNAIKAKELSAQELLQLFYACDITRRQKRFDDFLITCEAIAQSTNITFDATWLKACAQQILDVNVQELIDQHFHGPLLSEKIKEKRLEKIENWLRN